MKPDTDLLLQNFHDNQNFFEEKHPALFQKLSALETALVKGYYTPAYELVFENGYFDAVRTATGEAYYGKNSMADAQESASKVNDDKTEGVLETFSRPACKDNAGTDILQNHVNAVCSFSRYADEMTGDLHSMDKIHKFVFVGVGLGFHLQTIHHKIAAGAYLVIEDDLELFRLSLFTTRYVDIAATSDIEFSVFENSIEFDSTVSSFLNKGFFFNHYIKFHLMGQHPLDKVKLIQHAVLTQRHLMFAYHNVLRSALRPMDYIEAGYSFLDIGHRYGDSPFSKKPVLFLAAGPSLHQNSTWLQKHHSAFTIVAVSAALRTLHKMGIAPDIVTHIDGFEGSVKHFNGLVPEDFSDTLLIARANCNPGVMPYFKKENVFLFEMGSSYHENIGALSTPCVGSSTYLLLLGLGIKTMYILGLDLALDQATGATHTDGHIKNATIELADADRIEEKASVRTMLLPVKGNMSDEVLTTPLFKQSLDDLHVFVPEWIGEGQRIYNLGTGAYIPGTLAQNPVEVQAEKMVPNEKAAMRRALLEFLNAHSKSELSRSDIRLCQKRLEYAMDVQKAVRKHAQGKETGFDTYQLALFELIRGTIRTGSPEYKDLSQILLAYYKLVLTYVFDLFNTKGLIRQQEHVVVIRAMLSSHLTRIVNAYEERLRNFLQH